MIEKLKNPGTRIIVRLLQSSRGKEGIRDLQEALNRMGKSLVVDGEIGPITIAAIKSVNNKKLHAVLERIMYGGVASGIHSDIGTAKWIRYAYAELGTKEIPGRGSNKRVEQYHSAAGGKGWSDAVPWCASFVSFVMIKAGFNIPKYPARALSWAKFGVSAGRPVYGSIAVKKRKGGGHVTFVVGRSQDEKYVYCLGGNQNDAVNIARYPVSVFQDFRIPEGYKPTKELVVYTGRHVSSKDIREA